MYDVLAFTIAVEAIVVFFYTRRSIFDVIFVVTLLELVTHPISMYLFNYKDLNLWFVEGVVVIVEAFIYFCIWHRWKYMKLASMFLLSLLANIASLAFSYIYHYDFFISI